MSTIRVVNLQHTDATEPNIVLLADGTSVFASGITISGGTNLTVSGTAEFAAGTASAPGITFIDDNNTGLYSPTTDTVAITTAATERVRVDSLGNVGIGTSSFTAPSSGRQILEINGPTSALINFDVAGTRKAYHFADSTDVYSYNTSSGSYRFGTNNTERMQIDSSGRLLVGLSSSIDSGSKFQVEGRNSITAIRYSAATGNAGSKIELSRSASNTIGTTAAVSATDELGEIRFRGATSSSTFNTGAIIAARVESGTISSSSFPTALLFSTTADGASSSTERLRIDSSGRVGIGASSFNDAQEALRVQSTSGGTDTFLTIKAQSDSGKSIINFGDSDFNEGRIIYDHSSNSMQFRTDDSERMRIDSSSNLLVGLTSAVGISGTPADLNSTEIGRGYINISRDDTSAADHIRFGKNGSIASSIGTSTTNSLTFKTGTTERMRIDSNGSILFNTSTTSKTSDGVRVENGGQLNVSRGTNGDFILFYHSGDGAQIGSIRNNGGTGTLYNTSSDYRLKENVVDIADGITRVKQLSPRRFNFIADDTTTVDGFLAHEAQEVVPEAVTGKKDGEEMQGIDQSKLVPLLTAALQEAIAKIETLEQRLSDAGIT